VIAGVHDLVSGMNDVPSSTPRRGRPKSLSDAYQQDRALGALRRVLAERGYAGTTMDMVATAAGLSKKTLYALFDSKERLFGALVDRHRASILDLPRQPSDQPLAAELAAIFRLDADPADVDERQAVMHLMLAEARRHAELASVLSTHGPLTAEALLADWLSREQERGRIAAADPRDLASILLGLVFGVLVPRPLAPAPMDVSVRRRMARLAIDVFLDGARARGGAP